MQQCGEATMTIKFRDLAGAVALCTLALPVTSAALAQWSAPSRTGMPLDRLKSAYLECERAAVTDRLPTGQIMLCSVLFEELKHRTFDGDFLRLKAWADQHLRPQRSN
jgi:hypothetical protein